MMYYKLTADHRHLFCLFVVLSQYFISLIFCKYRSGMELKLANGNGKITNHSMHVYSDASPIVLLQIRMHRREEACS